MAKMETKKKVSYTLLAFSCTFLLMNYCLWYNFFSLRKYFFTSETKFYDSLPNLFITSLLMGILVIVKRKYLPIYLRIPIIGLYLIIIFLNGFVGALHQDRFSPNDWTGF